MVAEELAIKKIKIPFMCWKSLCLFVVCLYVNTFFAYNARLSYNPTFISDWRE